MSMRWWVVALGSLAGSIPFGVLITRRFVGTDVRAHGSGNIGATNVARVAGKKLGALVLVLDAVKGSGPVALAQWWWPEEQLLHVATAVAAFLGHVFSPWLKFKGGKGVATALGVMLVLQPWAALAGAVVWGVVVAIWRVSSVGSLLGALTAVAVGFSVGTAPAYAWLTVGLLGAMLFTHRENLKRLWARTENRV